MTVEFVFAPGTANELSVTDKIISYNPRKVHTGLGTLTASLGGDITTYDEYAQRNDRINVKIDGTVEFAGYVRSLNENERTAKLDLKADGIAGRLEETRPDYESLGGSLVYEDIALEDAIDDYWSRTPFSNYTVTAESTNTVATDEPLQEADTTTEFGNILSIPDTQPLQIDSGELQRVKSSILTEAENASNQVIAANFSDSNTSNGDAVSLLADGQQVGEPNTQVNYTIPAADAGVAYRYQSPDGNNPRYEVTLDGETLITFTEGAQSNTSWNWLTVTGVSSDITPGTHNPKIEVLDGTSNNDRIVIDCFTLIDTRYSYNFDNTVDGNGYLAGPEAVPSPAETIAFNEETVSYNITDGTINITANDTSNGQKIQITFDEGANWLPDDGSENNTTSVNPSSNTVGRSIQGRISLDGFGSRTTATPTERFQGQTIGTLELLASGNDLTVIDEIELSRNHFDNLQTLHQYGNYLWVIEHDGSTLSNMVVSSFQEGDETRPKPTGFDKQVNQSKEIQAGTYYNSIYLQGAKDANGDRPTAEVKDQTAISNDGREISPGVLRDTDITTEAGATFRASALLTEAQTNSDYVGSVTVPPIITDPGYARPVDFGSGESDRTVESVSLSESSGDAQATFEFATREDFAEDISSLRRNAREIGDAV